MYGRHDTSIRLLAHFVRMDYTYDAIIRLVILFVWTVPWYVCLKFPPPNLVTQTV